MLYADTWFEYLLEQAERVGWMKKSLLFDVSRYHAVFCLYILVK